MRFEKRKADSRLTRIMQTSRKTQKFSGIVPWIKQSAKQRHSNAPAQEIYSVFQFYLGCIHFVPEPTKNANAWTLLIGRSCGGRRGGGGVKNRGVRSFRLFFIREWFYNRNKFPKGSQTWSKFVICNRYFKSPFISNSVYSKCDQMSV